MLELDGQRFLPIPLPHYLSSVSNVTWSTDASVSQGGWPFRMAGGDVRVMDAGLQGQHAMNEFRLSDRVWRCGVDARGQPFARLARRAGPPHPHCRDNRRGARVLDHERGQPPAQPSTRFRPCGRGRGRAGGTRASTGELRAPARLGCSDCDGG